MSYTFVCVDQIYLCSNFESKSNPACFIDPAFSGMFDGNFEEIHFRTPSVVSGRFLNTNASILDLTDCTGCLKWLELLMPV